MFFLQISRRSGYPTSIPFWKTFWLGRDTMIFWNSAFSLWKITKLRKNAQVQVQNQFQKQVQNGCKHATNNLSKKTRVWVQKTFPKWMQKPIKIDVKIDMEKHLKFCSKKVECGNEGRGEGITPLSRMGLPRGLGSRCCWPLNYHY